MTNKYSQLFFDLDHTLWDFDKNSYCVLDAIFREFEMHQYTDCSFEDFYKAFESHNEKLWILFRKGHIDRVYLRWKRFDKTLQHFGLKDLKMVQEMSRFYLELLPSQKVLSPYAIDVLNYCKEKGYALYIITNGFATTQRQKLINSQILHYFDGIVTSELCKSMKPNKAIFYYTCQMANATPETALMIGDDWEADIIGAQSVGIDQVFYNPRKYRLGEDCVPTFEIQSLKELMQII